MSTILLVEDDLNTRLGLEEILAEEGYSVKTAADGEAALRAFKAGCPDLLISDLKLPGMSGIELHKMIKEIHPSIHTIIMSAYEAPDSESEGEALGVFSWLTKPLKMDSLLSTIKKAL